LWVLALQLLNMSICSEAYWYYYNENPFSIHSNDQADPTETIVEWLVEMKLGQQDAFTYDNNNIDSKNTVKAVAFQIDLENQSASGVVIIKQSSKILFANFLSKIESPSLEILSPPPDGGRGCNYYTI
jgi:hypothetical protein